MKRFFAYYRLLRRDLLATLALASPIIVANLGNVLMGETDKVMIRSLGVTAIDAAGFANALFWIVAVLGIGTLSVIAPQVSAAHGRQDTPTVARLLKAGMRPGLVSGLLLAGLVFILATFMGRFGQPEEVTRQAQPFLILLGLSCIPMMLFLSLKYFADGLSYTRVDMYITLGALVLNLFLNWVLVYGEISFPRMGLIGSATATLISRSCMAIAAAFYVLKAQVFQAYCKLDVQQESLKPFLLRIVKQGVPTGMQFFFETGAFACALIMMGWIGKYAQAAHIIAISPASTTFMAMAGIAASSSIRVARARGEGNRQGILRAGSVSLLLVILLMSLSALVFISFPTPIIQLYLENPEDLSRVAPLATTLLFIAGLFQLSDGIQVVGLNNLRGLEDVRIPTFITLLAYWIVGLPLGYLLAFPLGMEAVGMWIGLTAGLTVSAILVTIRFFKLARKVQIRWTPKTLTGETGKDYALPKPIIQD
jgi:MATE family multidrug resistance protein